MFLPYFRIFIVAFYKGESLIHLYLNMLNSLREELYTKIERWESNFKDSEDWIRNIANLVQRLRSNRNSRLKDEPDEYVQAVSKFREYHTDIDGKELMFPSLEDATRDDIREIMTRAVRCDTCVVDSYAKIAVINSSIKIWKAVIESLQLTPKNIRRLYYRQPGHESDERVMYLLERSMFSNRKMRVIVNGMLYQEKFIREECLIKRKFVIIPPPPPDFLIRYLNFIMNRLYNKDCPYTLPPEMVYMVCSFI